MDVFAYLVHSSIVSFQSLTDGHTTIDPKVYAVHPAAFVTCDEHNRFGYFFWLSHSPLRMEALDCLHNLLRLAVVECVGCGRPRRDGIDGDFAPTEVLGKHSSHLLDGALGGDVEQVVGRDEACSCEGSGKEHDTTALWDVGNGLLFIENGVSVQSIGGNDIEGQVMMENRTCLDQEKWSLNIDFEQPIEFFLGGIRQCPILGQYSCVQD